MKCKKCGEEGSIQLKDVPVKGKVYHYFYMAHYKGHRGATTKLRWCYLGKKKPLTKKKSLGKQGLLLTQVRT